MTKAIRLDFDDGDYVELRDPGELSYRTFRAVITETQNFAADGATPEQGAERAQKWLRDQILAWRVTDLDTGKVMVNPQTDDIEGVSPKLIKKVMETFMEAVRATAPSF